MPLPVATQMTRLNNRSMLPTPAVGMPLTHRWAGRSSIKAAVQSPARDMVNRNPLSPGAGTLAKECHSSRGLRLTAVEEPANGVTP
jgi:hypothetical protein